MLHQSSSISALPEHRFWGCFSGAVGNVDVWCSVGGVVMVVGSNLARGKLFTASIGSVDSLYPSVCIYLLYESASVSDPM